VVFIAGAVTAGLLWAGPGTWWPRPVPTRPPRLRIAMVRRSPPRSRSTRRASPGPEAS